MGRFKLSRLGALLGAVSLGSSAIAEAPTARVRFEPFVAKPGDIVSYIISADSGDLQYPVAGVTVEPAQHPDCVETPFLSHSAFTNTGEDTSGVFGVGSYFEGQEANGFNYVEDNNGYAAVAMMPDFNQNWGVISGKGDVVKFDFMVPTGTTPGLREYSPSAVYLAYHPEEGGYIDYPISGSDITSGGLSIDRLVADLNEDGNVDSQDVAIMTDSLLEIAQNSHADINRDGYVNGNDLKGFVDHYIALD